MRVCVYVSVCACVWGILISERSINEHLNEKKNQIKHTYKKWNILLRRWSEFLLLLFKLRMELVQRQNKTQNAKRPNNVNATFYVILVFSCSSFLFRHKCVTSNHQNEQLLFNYEIYSGQQVPTNKNINFMFTFLFI